MKRIILMAGLIGALAVPAAGAVTGPTLRVVTKSPLVVRGTSFKAGERVTVSAVGPKVVVRTSPPGAFRATLGDVLVDRCTGRVVASGARGDHASIAWRVECAPASTP